MGSGGPRGLQILPSGGSPVRGGFDSHTFPPPLALRPALVRALAGAALALLAPRAAGAQPAPDHAAALPEAAADSAIADTLPPSAAREAGTAAPAPRGFWSRPTGVMFRSLLVPGWGQATNGQWIKAGVVAAAEGALIAGILSDTSKLSDLDETDPERSQLLDDRQAKWWWLGGAVFLSMVDAYVSAHLRDIRIEPEPVGALDGAPGFGARVAVSFP